MTWICPWCRQPAFPVEVHGHVQCGRCGTNVDPCCGGVPAPVPAAPQAGEADAEDAE